MELQRIDEGLWRWTTPHPDWRPAEPDSVDDWGREVGSVLVNAADATVLIDPLVPDDGWETLDAHVARWGFPVVVLTTIPWHERSRDAAVDRWSARTAGPGDDLPAGVELRPVEAAGESMVWLPAHRTLVPGDRLLGDADGGLRTCPESWLRSLPTPLDHAGLVLALRPLLELPVRRVLVSHGSPVLEDGRAAIARALRDG
ncbi:hypothetical protein [Patulibacter sp.]|uniref:hypothetical protein n=1 Tax=Patulibacter sp. TaxID=1912859 RepID=UPI00271C40E0|nr:hypothetical protein [Patulibacter sp.]MDO9407631.1 hypothetical protein [Patulibacter sp.]